MWLFRMHPLVGAPVWSALGRLLGVGGSTEITAAAASRWETLTGNLQQKQKSRTLQCLHLTENYKNHTNLKPYKNHSPSVRRQGARRSSTKPGRSQANLNSRGDFSTGWNRYAINFSRLRVCLGFPGNHGINLNSINGFICIGKDRFPTSVQAE